MQGRFAHWKEMTNEGDVLIFYVKILSLSQFNVILKIQMDI